MNASSVAAPPRDWLYVAAVRVGVVHADLSAARVDALGPLADAQVAAVNGDPARVRAGAIIPAAAPVLLGRVERGGVLHDRAGADPLEVIVDHLQVVQRPQ